MSEPQSPPPPPAQPPAAKKKGLSPVAWILIGCGGILLLVFLAMGACSIFVAKKAKDFAENPARSAAEMIVRVNPDLELVGTDDDAETITIRSKESGEEMTFDWSEIQEGNFSFSSDEGEFRVNASGDEDGAVVTMTGDDGEKTQFFGAGSEADVPSWIPMADGATDVQSTFSMRNDEQTSGAFTYKTSSSIADVTSFYGDELEDAGFEVSRNTYSASGRDSASITGTRNNDADTIMVAIAEESGDTQVVVNYTDGG